jgi:hypothetical protein
MIDDSLIQLLSSLKHSPTFEVWRTVISYAIEGQFDDLIERLGGIETFVDTIVVNAVSPPATRLSLQTALDSVIATWQPYVPASYGAVEKTLRLISARTPPTGFVKVLGQLTEWKHFHVSGEHSSTAVKYLDDLALSALRNYFPVSPAEPAAFPAFDSYVTLLWSLMDVNGYRGHACQRLIELGRMEIRDRRVDALLQSFPEEMIPSILSWLLNTKRPEMQLFLSHIYLLTRSASDSADIFRRTLTKSGARLVEDSRSVQLVLRSEQMIELWVELEDFELTTAREDWQNERERVRADLEALANEVS